MEWNEHEPLPDLELDDLLNAWEIAVPSERLRAGVFPERAGLRRFRTGAWIAAAAACLLAAFAVGLLWNRTKTSTNPKHGLEQIAFADSGAGGQPFVPIPYTVPLSPGENATVVRMDVSVAELLAAGFRLPASDAAGMAPADVMVGEDGRALAIRLLTVGSNTN
jgi:hypothetical protein